MATATAAAVHHGTLVSTVVDTINLTQSFGAVRVTNRSALGPIFVRLDGTDPVLTADDNYFVMNNSEKLLAPHNTFAIQVRLICVGAAAYSVEGV